MVFLLKETYIVVGSGGNLYIDEEYEKKSKKLHMYDVWTERYANSQMVSMIGS